MSDVTPPPVIRRAHATDATTLVTLGRRTFRDAFGADNSEANLSAYLDSAYTERILQEELTSPHLTYFLAEDAGDAVGFALLRRGRAPACVTDDRTIELQRLYVDRAWHGTGLAHRLMATCLSAARHDGADSIFLGVWERNDRAIRFYEKHGFVPVGTHVFTLGADPQTDLVMRRSLDG